MATSSGESAVEPPPLTGVGPPLVLRSPVGFVVALVSELPLALFAVVIGAAVTKEAWKPVALVLWLLLSGLSWLWWARPSVRFSEESLDVQNAFRHHSVRYQDIDRLVLPHPHRFNRQSLGLVLRDGRRVRVVVAMANMSGVDPRTQGTCGRVCAELGQRRPDLGF